MVKEGKVVRVGDLVRRCWDSEIGLAVELEHRPRPHHLRHQLPRRFDVAVLWSSLDNIIWEDSDTLVVDGARQSGKTK